ncbi:uncharacterized protein RAG0_03150 [Rhynchosporium agropyri]|uniref:Protein kinase domain-containing protein n=1 Tax=Rhynchosporium agropyri TaxID=914238 RepID=A0A1E1K359_9HELO|nr:uncharacterized protein RAG0_03150 [Rhynchosporium agropyri]
MPLSLEPIVRSLAYPNERQLAAILSQIVTGLAYLAAEEFEHGSLSCSNILLNTDGDIEITSQECYHVKADSRPRDIRALSSITIELIQKYVKEDRAIGIDDLYRWQSNSDAIGFLSATTSAGSAAELLKSISETHHGTNLSKGNTPPASTVIAKPVPHSQALKSTAEAIGTPDTILDSPWDHYQRVFELRLDSFVMVVTHRASHDLFTMKRFQGADEVRMLQPLAHKNLHQMLQCFSLEDSYLAVFGYEPISLAHIVCCPPYLTELQLAAIVGQILDGLAYLAANGLEPGPYSCSNIPLDADGTVKMTSHESCKEISPIHDLEALGIRS